jgi:hypothetical protein
MPTEEVSQPPGEEEIEESSTPNKDLASAVVIGVLAILTMVASLRLDVPGSLYTAPGLLPFITGFTLLLMALTLGTRTLRRGPTWRPAGLFTGSTSAVKALWSGEQSRRRLALTALITGYVLLVAFVNFDLRLPTPLFEFQLSSYEVISVVMVTWILRMFWKAPLLRCFIVTLITVVALASVFRYGFGVLMPETF